MDKDEIPFQAEAMSNHSLQLPQEEMTGKGQEIASSAEILSSSLIQDLSTPSSSKSMEW